MQHRYKAWDMDKKEMFIPDFIDAEGNVYRDDPYPYVSGLGCASDLALLENVILLQFTSLHDSTKWEQLSEAEREKWTRDGNMPSDWKGKEIYEGDIARHYKVGDFKLENPIVGKVIIEVSRGIVIGNWPASKNIEIIGNIHANPELMK